MLSASTDTRRLGVCVKRLVANGHDLCLNDLAGPGWDKPEITQRWTTGEAALPAGISYLVVELEGVFSGWSRQQGRPEALPLELRQRPAAFGNRLLR